MYIFAYFLVYWIIYKKNIKSLVYWSHLDSYRRVLVCLFPFVFSAGLLKLNFNDTLVSSTHTFPVNIFNLEAGETMLARDKGNFPSPGRESNSRPSGSVVGTSDKIIKHATGHDQNNVTVYFSRVVLRLRWVVELFRIVGTTDNCSNMKY